MLKYFRLVLALVLGLAVAGLAHGQTAPPVEHFVMSGSAASFGGNGAASIASAGFQLSTNISLVYEFISNPNDSTKPRVGSGLANYTRSLATFVPAKLRVASLVDLSNYNVTLQGGAGVRSDASALVGEARSKSIVGNFGLYASRPLPGGHTAIGLGYKVVVGKHVDVVKVPVGTLQFTF